MIFFKKKTDFDILEQRVSQLVKERNEMHRKNKKYRKLLQEVIDCKHPNVFNVAGQLLFVQREIREELKKDDKN